MLAGIAVAIFLPLHPQIPTRLLIAWNTAVWSYLLLIGWLMTRATPSQARRIAEHEDNTGLIVLVVLSVAALASLVSIVMELSTIKGLPGDIRFAHYLLTGATVTSTIQRH